MPSELAQQMRDVVLDVKESMCTQISARQCEARRERSQIAQCNGLMWVWLWVTGCVRLCLMHMPVQVYVSMSERDTMRWEYCTKCVWGLFIVCVCVYSTCVSSALWDYACALFLSYCWRAWSLVRAFLNDKVYLSMLWYVLRKLALTAGGGSKKEPQQVPPPLTTQNVISSLAGSSNHPHEKNRHLKLCDMCQRRCHWATAADVARIDSTRAAGAGLGTYRVWWVSVPILVRASSQAAPQI